MEENAAPFTITIEKEPTGTDAGKIPQWILWLTLACIVFIPMQRIRIFVQFPLLTAIFAMELYYFMAMEEDFWWCNFDTMGWFKAVLLFLLSLGGDICAVQDVLYRH
ncbi:MAG: hypothetical protein LBU98_00555 [Alistipes sp.]|nr:hypothetical protein [Alistipes sp.]